MAIGCRSKVEYPDLSNMTYLTDSQRCFLVVFHIFLCERFGLGSGLELKIGLVLGNRDRYDVRVRSILFICTTVIETVNRKWLPCGILAFCCNC